MNSFFLVTFGCQMNKNDSDLMHLSLLENGFEPAADEKSADIIVFNTCSVRGHAEERAISRMRAARRGRDDHRTIVAAGCMAQRLGASLVEDRTADVVIGTYLSPGAGPIVRKFLSGVGSAVNISMDGSELAPRIGGRTITKGPDAPWHSWVTISHGCCNNCSYCIVPSVRGRLVSFPSGEILDHIASIASGGIREITLLGQNVNQYGQDSGDISFSRMLVLAAAIPGIEKINFMTSHPRDFTDDIIMAIRDNPNISRAIHLPLQSGSDRILALMNRGYTFGDYLRTVERISVLLGEYSLSTDLIVGFPGETEEEFQSTLDAVSRIGFDDAFMYAYSPREGTPSASLSETLTRAQKIARLEKLILLQKNKSRDSLNRRINRIERTILERVSKKSPDKIMGKTYLNHMVVVPGTSADIGKNIMVHIDRVTGSTLQGSRVP